ncbi:hypothetical protein HMPREF3034_00920 [Prevotella sp. DNF00663]|nr:hypothetical protein HMPREF3034_00920 [Prevotella sp. DNF00663]
MRNAQRGQYKGEKDESGQRYQAGLMEEIGYQRRTEKQNYIQRNAHRDAKPKHGVIVAIPYLGQIDESSREPAVLQIACDGRKDGQHTHDTIIRQIKQTSQTNTNNNIQQLGRATVHGSPKQSLGGFFFQ